jgi:pilus assembly protein Flp/PilA
VRRIRRFASDERAATAIEYGLILALIFLAMVGSVHLLATQVVGTLNHVSDKVVNASNV